MSLVEELRSGLGSQRDRVMIRGRFGEATGGELLRRIDGYAMALSAHGCAEGSTVVIAARPSPDVFAVLVAATALGSRGVLLDPRVGAENVDAQLALVRPDVIVSEASLWRLNRYAKPIARRMSLIIPRAGRCLSLGWSFGTGCPPLEILEGTPSRLTTSQERDSLVIFTSGTTSAPRGVVHTESTLLAGVRAVQGLVRPDPSAAVCGSQLFVLLPALCSGAPVEILAADPVRAAAQISATRPQATFLTPPLLRGVLAGGKTMHGRLYTGSAPVSVPLLESAVAAGFEEAWDVYALTEAFPVAAVELTKKRAFTGAGFLVGSPLPGVEVQIDATGELFVRGDNVVSRYLGQETFEWLRTGDRAELQGDNVVLTGRLKDMFLVAAENVYPAMYEPQLQLPGVRDAILVGAGDDPADQVPVLFVEIEPGADKDKVLRQLHEVSHRFGRARPVLVVTGELPRSGRNAKIDRDEASRQATARLAIRSHNR